jgi:hypothetical protein
MEPHTPIDLGYLPQRFGSQPTMNAMAALAMVFALVFFPLGILFGHVARRQIARTGETGSGLATTALVISYLLLGLSVCVCCGGLYLWGPKNT